MSSVTLLADVTEFAIFEDHEVVLPAKCLQLYDQIFIEVFDNVDVRLTNKALCIRKRMR